MNRVKNGNDSLLLQPLIWAGPQPLREGGSALAQSAAGSAATRDYSIPRQQPDEVFVFLIATTHDHTGTPVECRDCFSFFFSFLDGAAGGSSTHRLLGGVLCCYDDAGRSREGPAGDAWRETQLWAQLWVSRAAGLCRRDRESLSPLEPVMLGRADPPVVCRTVEPDSAGLGPDSDQLCTPLCHARLS